MATPIQATTTGEVILRDSNNDILIEQGTTVPADTTTGYAKGATFIDTDVATWYIWTYNNIWTNTSCVFQRSNNSWAPWLVTYQETFAYSDMTDWGSTSWTFALSTSIPEWAVVVQSFIDAVTGFAWDTSAVITIWDWTDVDRYNTWTPNVFATADHISAWAVSWTAYHSAAKTPTVTITSGADFTSVSAGQVTVTVMYYQSV